ncbi:MAG TPA: glycoside hydrolase family 97 N-terminal domain-containing protein, partial [Puia sp.]|nr:glycoside hydrolase family 97 N-terminal domain-containing protein [Puia sp.]
MRIYLRRFCRLLLPVGIFLAPNCFGQVSDTLYSPAGRIRFTFQLTDSSPVYSVWYANTPLIVASPLTLVFNGSAGGAQGSASEARGSARRSGDTPSVIGPGLQLLTPIHRQGRDEYTLPIGKNSSVHDRFNESMF